MWLLSKGEASFYNWFAAALALLIGQAICIAYWFARPKRFKERGIRNRSAILNNQSFLQANFLMWYLKLGVLYALFYGLSWANAHVAFSFYPNYAIILVLVLFVLFFQSWNTIRLKFKSKSYKWMLISFFGLALGSLGLSTIHIVDYERANETVLAENIWYSQDLQLPVVSVYSRGRELTHVDSYIYFREIEDTNAVVLCNGNHRIPVYKDGTYYGFPNSWHWNESESNYYDLEYRLYIDKSIKMGVVQEIFQDFSNADITNLTLAVLPSNSLYPAAAHHGAIINACSNDFYQGVYQKQLCDTVSNQIKIRHEESGIYKVNGTHVTEADLEMTLYDLFFMNPDFRVEYVYSEDLSFNDYLQFEVISKKAIVHYRDFFTWDEHGRPYYGLDWHFQELYAKAYPLRILRISESRFNSK
jgi:hypothetical protein